MALTLDRIRTSNALRRLRTSRSLPVILLLLGSTVLGLAILDQFGESIDEATALNYGAETLGYYFSPSFSWEWYGHLKYYGPFFLMASNVVAGLLSMLSSQWLYIDYVHLTNFLAFQLAVLAVYLLSIQFVSTRAAFMATALFATQPLLFGHAFINSKDNPFMAFFALTMATGFIAASALKKREPISLPAAEKLEFAEIWRASFPVKKWAFGLLVFAALLLTVELALVRGFILPQLLDQVESAYLGVSWPLVNDFFASRAEFIDELPLASYQHKASELYTMLLPALLLVIWLPAVVLGGWIFRRPLHALWRTRLRPRLESLRTDRSTRLLILAGVVLGLTISVRILGPFAGALISLVILSRLRLRAILPLAAYWVVALLTSFATWPYLWDDPIQRLVSSLARMSNSQWDSSILYQGSIIEASELPWHFIPVLLSLQLTETALLLAGAGILLGILWVRRRKVGFADLTAIVLWFFLPVLAILAVDARVYDNFRHLMFVVPALFVLAAFSIGALFRRLNSGWPAIAFASMILLPGIVGLIQLHPYQYIYYNSNVGGVRGAFRKYELDYWCISYRAAMERANANLPPSANVAAWGPSRLALRFARSDLNNSSGQNPASDPSRDLVFVCTRTNMDEWVYLDNEPLWAISVMDVPLTIAKRLH